jgi:hypothetical protein
MHPSRHPTNLRLRIVIDPRPDENADEMLSFARKHGVDGGQEGCFADLQARLFGDLAPSAVFKRLAELQVSAWQSIPACPLSIQELISQR